MAAKQCYVSEVNLSLCCRLPPVFVYPESRRCNPTTRTLGTCHLRYTAVSIHDHDVLFRKRAPHIETRQAAVADLAKLRDLPFARVPLAYERSSRRALRPCPRRNRVHDGVQHAGVLRMILGRAETAPCVFPWEVRTVHRLYKGEW